MAYKVEKQYLEIQEDDMCACFSNERQKQNLYNLIKNEINKICYGLELAKEAKPKDRVIRSLFREYTSYFKNFK